MATKTKLIDKLLLAGKLVDEMGRVKAEIAELQTREADLRTQLIDYGIGVIEGNTFRATVSTHDHTSVDWKAVVEALPPTPVLKRSITRHTETSERTTVKIVSRQGLIR